ncbi:MAG: phosphoadenosine phosphosulfate reductase family protein [Candidatus Aenigmarchaeota archaeon]|nr:phosphoadenosine phosphosulfate reductase family protein [Candidatus Aenigmarchaeota archaeon]
MEVLSGHRDYREVLGVYWCKECNVPLISRKCNNCNSMGEYVAVDMKPVFSKEKEMYEDFFDLHLPDNLFVSRNRLILDGKTLCSFRIDFHKMKLVLATDRKKVLKRIDEAECRSKEEFWDRVRKANESSLSEKINEAVGFIREVSQRYSNRFKVISFSGGKDSEVTADLVKKVLGNVPLFFADTTLEYKETIEFIKEFAKKYNFELLTRENDDFYRNDNCIWDMIRELGPPSIPYRWCCSVFKAYPVNLFHKSLKKETLAFDGIRKYESFRRRKYEQVSRIKKIANQLAAYPIFYWKELEVWFYIIFNRMIYNPLYEYGHRRVGCWLCPNASPFNCFIRKKTHPEKWQQFEKVLLKYAYEHGRNKNWVIENYWRLRRPKKDKIPRARREKKADNVFLYKFTSPIREHMFEFFKPLGEYQRGVNQPGGAEEKVIKIGSGNPISIKGFLEKKEIIVEIKEKNELKNFERQLLKAMNCIGCGGCIGHCPNGALYIKDKILRIDDSRCTKCRKCITAPCVSLDYKIEKAVISGVKDEIRRDDRGRDL